MKPINVPLGNREMEEGAKKLLNFGLLRSELMRPYLDVGEAIMEDQDASNAMAEIEERPLEKRYVWHVASALRRGFASFDSLAVEIDRDTLSQEDRQKVVELFKHRPIQFCIFLRALLGADEMQRMMLQAIKVGKQIA